MCVGVCGSQRERMDVRDGERRDKVVNCQFYGLTGEKERKKDQERALVKAYGWREKPSEGGVKERYYLKEKGKWGVERPVPLPVPCALGGGVWSQCRSRECEA